MPFTWFFFSYQNLHIPVKWLGEVRLVSVSQQTKAKCTPFWTQNLSFRWKCWFASQFLCKRHLLIMQDVCYETINWEIIIAFHYGKVNSGWAAEGSFCKALTFKFCTTSILKNNIRPQEHTQWILKKRDFVVYFTYRNIKPLSHLTPMFTTSTKIRVWMISHFCEQSVCQ